MTEQALEAANDAPALAVTSVGKTRRHRTPTVLQHEITECGAACLAMVLGYHHKWVSLEEVRHATGVNRDGASAHALLKAAGLYGLDGRGVRCDLEDLAELPLPAILFYGFEHFVVLEGCDGDHVWLNDPAIGPYRLSVAELDPSFTGVALLLEPTPEFQPGGRPPGALQSARERLRSFAGPLAATVLAGFLLLAPGLLIPGLQRAFTDFYLVAGLKDWLWWLVGGMAGAAALKMLLTYLQQRNLARFQVGLALVSNGRLLWHLLRLPLAFFSQRGSGELANRSSIADRLSGLLAGSLGLSFVNLAAITVYGAVMLSYDLALAGIAIGFGLLNVALLATMTRHLQATHGRMLQEEARLQGMLFQGFANLETYQASGTEDLFFQRWATGHARVVSAEQAMQRWRRLLNNFVTLLVALTGVAVVLLGGLRVMDGVITVGMLVAFQSLMASFNAPVQSFVGLSAQLQDARGYVERLDGVLHQPVDPLLEPGREIEPLAALHGRVEVEAVRYGFAPVAPPFFDGLTLAIPPGHRVAIVGPSGSGKSTLGRLLVGLIQPQAGTVRYDGVPLPRIDRHLLRSAVGYVDQSVMLFPGTVRDNITMWDPAIPEERVLRAARDAMIDEAISERRLAYATVMEEDGRNFSGGEAQRLVIARALAVDPAVVVLDEATSALDALAEKAILDNIRRRGCTAIIISHRLSAIRDCDEIIVLDHGRIVARGHHSELQQAGTLYRGLLES